jgi:hypothetical protein
MVCISSKAVEALGLNRITFVIDRDVLSQISQFIVYVFNARSPAEPKTIIEIKSSKMRKYEVSRSG